MALASSRDADAMAMLEALGLESVEELFSPIPTELRLAGPLAIPGPLSDIELTQHCRELAFQDLDGTRAPCFAGTGVYDHFVPSTVAHLAYRGEFATAYTAYQPELSQGMLAALFEFQTMVCELTAMDVSNSSVYDGGTALTEAAFVAAASTKRKRVLVASTVNPRYVECLRTGAGAVLDIDMAPAEGGVSSPDAVATALTADHAALIVQHPNYFGCLEDVRALTEAAHAAGALLAVSFDPVSLGLLEPPGAYGADIAVGEGGSMCGPMSLGGPGLGLFTCRKNLVRSLPGRVVGKTVDHDGRVGYVNTLQTREQHIRRDKATSNICTNQALCAVAAGVYMATMGPSGIRRVGELCLQKAHYAADRIGHLPGFDLAFDAPFFKEFVVRCPRPAAELIATVGASGTAIAGVDVSTTISDGGSYLAIAVTEKRTRAEIDALVRALATAAGVSPDA